MLPPIRSMLVRTTSIPTPRPDTVVTSSAVEKPGAKSRSTTSRSDIRVACSGVMEASSTAFALTASRSIPAPSSDTSIVTWPPSW